MAYIIGKVNVTKANHSIDGKEHKRTVYYAGKDTLCGFGMSFWDKKNKAVRFDDMRTAERYAKSYGGRVIRVSDK